MADGTVTVPSAELWPCATVSIWHEDVEEPAKEEDWKAAWKMEKAAETLDMAAASSSSGYQVVAPQVPLAESDPVTTVGGVWAANKEEESDDSESESPIGIGSRKWDYKSPRIQQKPKFKAKKKPRTIRGPSGAEIREPSVVHIGRIPLEVDVTITNKCSGRKLYAAEGYNWLGKVGAGSPPSAVHADGNWRITKEGDGFRFINQASDRCLYAKPTPSNWENGVGAGSPPWKVEADGVWYITPEEDGFRIINKHSQRCLYAARGRNWQKKVGAGWPSSAVHADGIWYIQRVLA